MPSLMATSLHWRTHSARTNKKTYILGVDVVKRTCQPPPTPRCNAAYWKVISQLAFNNNKVSKTPTFTENVLKKCGMWKTINP